MAGISPDEGETLRGNVVLKRVLTDRDANLELGLFTNTTAPETITEAAITEPNRNQLESREYTEVITKLDMRRDLMRFAAVVVPNLRTASRRRGRKMKRAAFTLLFGLIANPALAAPWGQLFDVVATDPNGGAATAHEFQARVNGGTWSATQSEATPSTQFTLSVDHGYTIDVQARPCADGLCADWVSASYVVPSGLLPYSTITITVPAWQKP